MEKMGEFTPSVEIKSCDEHTTLMCLTCTFSDQQQKAHEHINFTFALDAHISSTKFLCLQICLNVTKYSKDTHTSKLQPCSLQMCVCLIPKKNIQT